MTRLIEINYCWECPHFMRYFKSASFGDGFCSRVGGRKIEDLNRIPEWCPLPRTEKKEIKKEKSAFRGLISSLRRIFGG